MRYGIRLNKTMKDLCKAGRRSAYFDERDVARMTMTAGMSRTMSASCGVFKANVEAKVEKQEMNERMSSRAAVFFMPAYKGVLLLSQPICFFRRSLITLKAESGNVTLQRGLFFLYLH